jgi:hypothetical protein
MPAVGPKPTGRGILSGNTPRIDWTEVPNVPYAGPKPELPAERQSMLKNGEIIIVPMGAATEEWWSRVTSMPHCVIWGPTDWQFCLDTAKIHSAAQAGSIPANVELRQREKIMGTTWEARRDLRIRYIDPEPEAPVIAAVTSIDDRRSRLLDA